MPHVPVLQKEVIEFLSPRPGENFVDGTCGAAGHAEKILERIGEGKLICVDLDEKALSRAGEKLSQFGNAIFVNDNFANLNHILGRNNIPISGILVDLGMSSDQLEESGRGFSFLKDEPLDMRFSARQELTAAQIVNSWSEPDLGRIFKEYGEERFAKKIAAEIANVRRVKKILTTRELSEIVARAVPGWYRHGRTHYATKIFQALRIAVNRELESLNQFLPQASAALVSGGRLGVIAFHSLEDRIVKNFFREKKLAGEFEILTKKPITASVRELENNPRSRSAKLRVARKI